MLENEEMAEIADNVPHPGDQVGPISHAQKSKKQNFNKQLRSSKREEVHEVNQAAELGIVDKKFV